MKNAPTILVVDDQQLNVKLLQRMLEREGMEVIPAYNGPECLEKLEEIIPDIILLDVMMPGMNGIEVCEKIKDSDRFSEIPIIFITAKDTTEGKIQGLEAGAADYITKPINLDETRARVNTQLRILESHRQNLDLQRRLADTRQTAAVGFITQGIAHNLNNLLGVSVGYLDLIKAQPENMKLVGRATSQIDKAVKRMAKIVNQLSVIATNERHVLRPSTIDKLIDNAITRYTNQYENQNTVIIDDQTEGVEFSTNFETFEDILCRLMINAWESYPDTVEHKKRVIKISCKQVQTPSSTELEISVIDEGSGIDPELKDHIFEPFISSDAAVGRGMGLTIARHGARGLGGDLKLMNGEEKGTIALLTHPS